jgi:diguanylate cyclase (GGDEF)-like protein
MNLNTRFVLMGACVFMLFAAATGIAFNSLVNEINQQWGEQFAERQVLFDKHRTLSPLIREIRLARQMAAEPAIIQMALHEDDREIKLQALKVMESYRFNFRDHSYFAAFLSSGNYYFNDATGKYSDKQYRYTLSAKNKSDYWFYSTVKNGIDYQVNIDPDYHLDVVKVWINVLIKNGDKVLGVLGTGIDLTEFLKESVGINQPGVENFFIDQSMAIQLSTDTKLIDYASIAKTTGERIKVDVLLKNPDDLERLNKTAEIIKSNNGVSTLWVNYRGEQYLLCMSYLPEIGWYDLTLIDKKNLMLFHGFSRLPILFGAFFLMALLLLNFFFQHWVLKPVKRLKASTEEIQQGHYNISPPIVGTGEIAALSNSFKRMVEYIRQSNAELERKVEARTEELQRLTEIDPLTGLLNRRGMIDRFEKEISRYTRQAGSLGLLLLDLDYFKQVNDAHGHLVGDLALCTTANILQTTKRNYDHAGRWGGEEFLLLLPDCTEADLLSIAERIRLSIEALQIDTGRNTLSFTVSIGAHYSSTPQTMDAMLHQVDKALYAAKDAGRNCVWLAGKQTNN